MDNLWNKVTTQARNFQPSKHPVVEDLYKIRMQHGQTNSKRDHGTTIYLRFKLLKTENYNHLMKYKTNIADVNWTSVLLQYRDSVRFKS